MTTTTDEAVCLACEGEGEAHDVDVCGYVNAECPSGCHTEHEVDRHYIVECPETSDRWRWCSECGWEVAGRWADDPTEVNGRLYCAPYDHDLDWCCECGDWHWTDDLMWSDYHGASFCRDCYTPRRGVGDTTPAVPLCTCSECGTANTHFDPAEEEFLCTCKATTRRLLVAA